MGETPVVSRDRDPIEAIFHFLFRNWILLVSLPVIAGVAAFVITLDAPRSFTASLRIPAPPAPVAAFDQLWVGADRTYDGMAAPDGSVLVSHTAATEKGAREPVEAARAATRHVAAEALASAQARQIRISDLEARLIDQPPAAEPGMLADQVKALSLIIATAEGATRRSSALGQWAQRLGGQQVAVSSSTGTNQTVTFAAFGAFMVALAIAIVRWLLSQARNGRQSG